MIKSKALEINLASYHVDVEVDERYAVLQDIMSRFYGLMDGLNTFLKELSHPYKNYDFIISEARTYALDYFHLLGKHPRGPQAAGLYIEIFEQALLETTDAAVRAAAADNLMLYLRKIIKDADPSLPRFVPVLAATFERLSRCDSRAFDFIVKSYYQVKGLGELLLITDQDLVAQLDALNRLMLRICRHTFTYWRDQKDPAEWLLEEIEEKPDEAVLAALFEGISHQRLEALQDRLDQIEADAQASSQATLEALVALPNFNQFVESYRQIPHRLLKEGQANNQGHYWKVVFLFHIMSTRGLRLIHEEALRDINVTMSWIIGNQHYRDIQKLIEKTFSILKDRQTRFPATTLNCVLTMGKSVFQTDDGDLINYFIDCVIHLGFHTPKIGGVGNDWQIKVNPAHIINIRTWLQLVEQKPSWAIRLLSSLIIHLALSGVFIRDTDLFPRDITRLLNSDIGAVYNLTKQLTRMFPVFFNDIGAEGSLRDISTNIDEITRRKDPLIHFLRKQSHVESSNRTLALMEATLGFWLSGRKQPLKAYLPPLTYEAIDPEGPYVEGVHQLMRHLADQGLKLPEGLLTIEAAHYRQMLKPLEAKYDQDIERLWLGSLFYRHLHQKYNVNFTALDEYLRHIRTETFPHIKRLQEALASSKIKKKLYMLLEYLEMLKATITTNKRFEVREDIYKKRHITVDIPSMYGSYHERKFDALGLTFRIEALVNVLFEQLVEDMDLNLITKATFHQIFARLRLFYKALKVDGIVSIEMEHQLDFLAHSLEIKGFSFTQYLDIFKGFARAVKNIINDYFNNLHDENLKRILTFLPKDHLLPKYLPQEEQIDSEGLQHRISEIFSRDRIAHSLGLQQLDLFITRILNTLFEQSHLLSKENLRRLLLYDPKSALTSITESSPRVSSIIFLGNKGFNLVQLSRMGLPVPPGFIVTTETFRLGQLLDKYEPVENNFHEQVLYHLRRLETQTGKRFGDPHNPLLLSIRSGSSISQPGMMDTFLDVGLNEEITQGLAHRSGNPWFAWDSYRRLLQGYGMTFSLERDDFDAIIDDCKRRWGLSYKSDFSGEQMQEVALSYKQMILDAGIVLVETPYEQLFTTIKLVMRSWNSAKAETYRRIMGISDDWGTAVTIQSMVYGNKSRQSGTGVIFTHNPRWSGESIRLWGDFTLGNQGEDVVSGLVQTLPISIRQQETEMRETDVTLQTHFPNIYEALKDWARELIFVRGWSPQELEFTFEGPTVEDLYLLQSRDMAMRERKKVLRFDFQQEIGQENWLGHGVGVSGGAMSGRVVFSLEEINRWRALEPATSLILVRGDTVPDDILEIYSADGLLTARGGLTSHAAVVAHRLDKTCVVGCRNLICSEKDKHCFFNSHRLAAGDYISIDGQEGSVYQGQLKVKET